MTIQPGPQGPYISIVSVPERSVYQQAVPERSICQLSYGKVNESARCQLRQGISIVSVPERSLYEQTVHTPAAEYKGRQTPL